jgi:hypothetical protein
MRVANFNFHNLLRVRFEWRKCRALLKSLDLSLSYFLVDELKNPDITVRVGPFKPAVSDCRVYERKFFVKEGFFYGEGGNWRANWAVQIEGLEKDEIFVNINAKTRSFRGILAPNMLVNLIVIPLLELKFLEKNYVLLHAGAVSKNRKGLLIVGRGGSAKTSIVMDLVRKHGYEYMGDDRVLVGKNLLSFPTHVEIFYCMLKNARSEHLSLHEKIKLIFCLRNLRIKNLREFKICDMSPLNCVLFIHPSSRPYKIKSLSVEDAKKKILANMLTEYFEMARIVGLRILPTFEFFNAYSAAFPNSSVSKFQEKLLVLLEDLLSGLPIYEVSVPIRYEEGIASVIDSIFEREIR